MECFIAVVSSANIEIGYYLVPSMKASLECLSPFKNFQNDMLKYPIFLLLYRFCTVLKNLKQMVE